MSAVYLRKINPTKNMARFYHVDLAPNLFGEFAVLRSWGRIGTQGRTMIETCGSVDAARQSAGRIVRIKLRRGYAAM